MRFDFFISHVAGKDLFTADALSRSPISEPAPSDVTFQDEVQAFLDVVIQNLPATANRLEEIKSQQDQDLVCHQLTQYNAQGWPH